VENSTKANPLDAPILPMAKITHGVVNLVQFIVITRHGITVLYLINVRLSSTLIIKIVFTMNMHQYLLKDATRFLETILT